MIVDFAAKITDAPTHCAAKRGNTACPKQQKDNQKDDNQFPDTKIRHLLPPSKEYKSDIGPTRVGEPRSLNRRVSTTGQ